MDFYQQQNIRDIENALRNIDARLQGKPKLEQEKILNDERDNLLAIVRNLLSNRVPIIGGFLAWCTTKIASFFGYDPFEWLHFTECNHNANFADKASSDPHLFNALMKAGEIFDKTNSRYLRKKSNYFQEDVTSVTDANALAELIISFSRILTVDLIQSVLLDPNDVKNMLAGTIKLILNSSKSEQKFEETYASPIVQPSVYAWVKYKFNSNSSVESSCCSEKKSVQVDVNILYYYRLRPHFVKHFVKLKNKINCENADENHFHIAVYHALKKLELSLSEIKGFNIPKLQ